MAIVYQQRNIGNTKVIASFRNEPIKENIISISYSKELYLKKFKTEKAVRLFLKLSKSKNFGKSYDVKFFFNNQLCFDYSFSNGVKEQLFNIWQDPTLNFYAFDFVSFFTDNSFDNPIKLKNTFFSRNKITHDDVLNFTQEICNRKKHNMYSSIMSGIHIYELKNIR